MSAARQTAWYAIAVARSLASEPVQRWIFGEPIVLFRNELGAAVALSDICPHRNAPLSLGKVVGGNLQCPYHGLQFDAAGRCALIPGQRAARAAALSVKPFAVLERYGLVWIWPGEYASADPSVLIPWPYYDDAAYRTLHGELVIDAPVEMIIDNLMDLTHIHFVHRFGTNIRVHDSAPMKVWTHDTGVAFSRDVTAARFLSDTESAPRVDSFLEVGGSFHFPAVVKTHAITVSADTRATTAGPRRFVVHALTPQSDCSVRYVYMRSWNLHHAAEEIEAAILEDREALEEDKRIIEATYQLKKRVGSQAVEHLLGMDEAAVRARRQSERLSGDT